MAYGFTPSIDVSLLVPFLMDSIEGLNKYGTGDPVLGLKWSRSPKQAASFYTAFQLQLGLPLGYKGEHGLDKVGGIRPYSTQSLDMGLLFLMDMHFRHASIYLNGGYLRPGNTIALPQLVYGVGLEIGRSNRWASFNVEYQTRVAFSEQSRAAGVLKVGTRVNIFRGVELELNRENGLLDHPIGSLFTVGLRLHGVLGPHRRLESRHVLYQPVAPPKRAYEPTQVLRIAIVDFAGFEEYQAGKRLVEKIKARLEPHDSLEVVDLRRYAGVPYGGFLKPRQAQELARKLGVDVVITGAVADFKINRFAGLQVPYVFYLPQAEVRLALDYRVMEFFDAEKTEMQAFAEMVGGVSRLRQRPRLLPADRHDITAVASARELHAVQDAALDDLVSNLLGSMAARFTWIPPDFTL